MLASATPTKCPYCQTYHREVAKMLGATEQELQELAVVVAGSAFWSNILHVENYDYNTIFTLSFSITHGILYAIVEDKKNAYAALH